MSEENTEIKDTEEDILAASKQGWKADYEGDKPKSAKQFLEDGEKHAARLKDRNQQLVSQVKDLQTTMSDLVADQSKQKEKAVEKAIAALNKQKVEAINDSDGEAVVKIDGEIDRLKEETKPKSNPVFDHWVKDNQWFNEHPELRMEADFYANLYAGSGQSPEKVYEAVTKRIKKEYPDYFENPNKKEPASMSGSSHSKSSPANGKTYNDLPTEAKAACDRFVKTIPKFTQEKYLANYEWD